MSNDELEHAAWKHLDCYEENRTVAFHARWGKGTRPLGRRRHLSRSGNDRFDLFVKYPVLQASRT
jgi:hypothetical protein